MPSRALMLKKPSLFPKKKTREIEVYHILQRYQLGFLDQYKTITQKLGRAKPTSCATMDLVMLQDVG